MAEPSLVQLTSAPTYLRLLHQIVDRIAAARAESDVIALFEEATRRIGADVATFASFMRGDVSRSAYRIMLAGDPRWGLAMERQPCLADDPWIGHARMHSEPIRGRDLSLRSEGQRAWMRAASSFGYVSTVVVPAPSAGGTSRLGVLCLGRRTPGFFDGAGFSVVKFGARSLAMEMHEWHARQARVALAEQAKLGPEDLRLLQLEQAGRCTKEIARLLGTTTSSIDSRFQRLNARLGVCSRKLAARLAVEYGLISAGEP